MEIRTTEEIQEWVQQPIESDENMQWVAIDDIIKEVDKVWHKISKCKMDKVQPNFITKTQVAYYMGELKKALSKSTEQKALNQINAR